MGPNKAPCLLGAWGAPGPWGRGGLNPFQCALAWTELASVELVWTALDQIMASFPFSLLN